MLETLTYSDRMRLMQFVCSFAWADLEIQPEEREFVARLIDRLGFDADERSMVKEWLKVPPAPDPLDIPREHRALFVEAIRGVIAADGYIAKEESESLALLELLLAEDASA